MKSLAILILAILAIAALPLAAQSPVTFGNVGVLVDQTFNATPSGASGASAPISIVSGPFSGMNFLKLEFTPQNGSNISGCTVAVDSQVGSAGFVFGGAVSANSCVLQGAATGGPISANQVQVDINVQGTGSVRVRLLGGLSTVGGGSSNLTLSGLQYSILTDSGTGQFAQIGSPVTNGTNTCMFNVTAGVAVPYTCALPGIPVDATNPATLLYSDRTNFINWTNGAAMTFPAISGSFANNMPFLVRNTAANDLSFTPTTPNNCDGGTSQAACTLHQGSAVFWYSDALAPANWWPVKFPVEGSDGSVRLETPTNGVTNPALTLVGNTQSNATTAPPILSMTGTYNNASVVGQGIKYAVTNTSSSVTSLFLGFFGGAAGATQEFVVTLGGIVQASGLVESGQGFSGPLASSQITLASGTTTTNSAGSAPALQEQGEDNSSNSAAATAGPNIVRGGMLTNATPNAAAIEGPLNAGQGYLKGSAIANVGDAVCGTTTAFTVTDCGTTGTNFIGIATNTTNPIGVISYGSALVKLDGALTAIGDNVCLSTTTAGLGHDNASTTTACPLGTAIGVIIASSGTVSQMSGTTQASTAMSNTLVLVQLHIAQ
jgi:hypothetical protein